MDETNVLRKFQWIRVLTIEQVVELLKSSVITARRHLKKWRAYTSFNHNGRYYTLPGIPQFDQNGIWKYQTILFSKYGNLKQTIIQLISQSDKGLSAKEIAQVVKIPSNSSVVSQYRMSPELDEKSIRDVSSIFRVNMRHTKSKRVFYIDRRK